MSQNPEKRFKSLRRQFMHIQQENYIKAMDSEMSDRAHQSPISSPAIFDTPSDVYSESIAYQAEYNPSSQSEAQLLCAPSGLPSANLPGRSIVDAPTVQTPAISVSEAPTAQVPAVPITGVPTARIPSTPLADMSLVPEAAFAVADLPTASISAVTVEKRLTSQPPVKTPGTVSSDVTVVLEPGIREQIERYMRWLARNNHLQEPAEKVQAYQGAAMEIKKLGKREVRTFAPFQEQTSALRVITPAQIAVLILLFLCWGAGFFFLHLTMMTVTLGAITLLYIAGFITSGILATGSFSSGSGEKIEEKVIQALDQLGVEWPLYTILCPLYKETAVVPQFVAAMKALEYPEEKLQVLFLTEENDKETRAALYNMSLPSNFTVLTVPEGSPQTKPRACNFGLMQAKGQFIVIFDAEDKPEPYQLKRAVLTFANHGSEAACVQAKLNYYNSQQNLLTRWFTAEYSTWFDILLPGLQRVGFSLPLGGTSNHFRTEVLRALGGWDAFNVTEDCDLGLRISQYGLQTAVLDSTTYEEATSRYKTWLFQRSRWIKGYMQTYLVHMRHPLRMLRKGHLRKFLSLQIIVGAWTIVLLLNPIMWAFTANYLLFRPIQLYKVIFPGPVLYAGAFCLIFGNFFYIYIHTLGCLRRKEYSLIKWVLLLPLYWIMMSISAYIAFYQLIVKPHYWEKTQHGNHLAAAEKAKMQAILASNALEERSVASSLPTLRVQAIRLLRNGGKLESTTQRVSAVRTLLTSHLGQHKVRSKWVLPLLQNRWLITTFVVALAASITSIVYMFQHNLILIDNDAPSHLFIARSVFDSTTPGIAQLGGDWLPLPHILLALLVWNDYLWTTGLAGSIVGACCYLTAVVFIFLAARRLTRSNWASFIGSLVFILNPNILYLQGTPLTEPVCWATFTMACYFMLAWMQEDRIKYLILAAAGTFLATLTRYDGWVLIGIFPVVILVSDILKRQSLRKIEGHLAVFLLLGGLGIILWLVWDEIIFHDPLYFIRGAYSSHAQTVAGHQAVVNAAISHHLLTDIRIYTVDSIETVGIVLAFLAFIAIALYILRNWHSPQILAVLAFLAPFVFYCAALYGGQVNLLNSNEPFYPLGILPLTANPDLSNARFGSQMVAPVAIFIATLVPVVFSPRTSTLLRRWAIHAGQVLLVVIILLQLGWVAFGGAISMMASLNPPFCARSYAVSVYLQEHYNGGYILHVKYPFIFSESEAGIHFDHVIYEGSGPLWDKALREPEDVVDWIITKPGDRVFKAMEHDKNFHQNFTLVAVVSSENSVLLLLYHRNGLPPLPSRPISIHLLNEQQFCAINNYPGK